MILEALLVLGGGRMQVPAIRSGRERGLRVIAADPDPNAVGLSLADESIVCDLADVESCLQKSMRDSIKGVVTLGADYPLPTLARLCRELGLPGISVEAAYLATNKHAMREVFARAGVPSPRSIPVSTIDEARKACEEIGIRTIFKPVLSSGGRGITVVDRGASVADVQWAFSRAMAASRADGVLLEEWVDGPEFSVEAVTVGGETTVLAITDKFTSGPPYHVELGHSQPSRAGREDLAVLERTAIQAVAALGIDNAPSHTEIRIGVDGPRVMEVAGRLGGGYITSHLVPLSTGIDMVGAAVSLAVGGTLDLTRGFSRGAAICFLTPPPGRVGYIEGIAHACSLAGIREVDVYVRPGEAIRPLLDATARVGHVIAEGEDAPDAIARAAHASSIVTFVLA